MTKNFMVINFYGEGCFKISEGPLTVMVDPYESSTGLTPPRFKSDIVIKTLLPTPTPETIKPISFDDGETNVISGPGEFEVKSVIIKGWPLQADSSEKELKSIFRVQVGDMTLGLLGHISKFAGSELFEELGDIDILIIPGGNAPYISQSDAAKVIRQIEPRLVIPSFFAVKGLKRKASDVKDFLKELGHSDEKPQEKLTLKKKDLDPEKMQVVVLAP